MFVTAITAALVTIAVALWLRWRQKHFTTFERLGIPGPKPNIFFGNMLEMQKMGAIKCQDNWIKQHGKLLGFYYGFRPVLLVADIDLLKQIEIKEFHNFVDKPDLFAVLTSNTPFLTKMLTQLKGQRWKEVRSIITPAFTSGKMKQMTGLMNKAVDEMMENIEENAKRNQEFDIYGLYKRLTMDVIGQTALGIESGVQKAKDHPLIRTVHLLLNSAHLNWILLIGISFPEFRSIFRAFLMGLFVLSRMENPIQKLLDICLDVVTQRKKDPAKRRGDLLQGLIDAEGDDDHKIDEQTLTLVEDESEHLKEGTTEKAVESKGHSTKRNLSMDEIASNALLMLLAGYESTSTALAFTTHYLLNHPEIEDLLHEEVDKVLQEAEGDISYSSLQDLKLMDQVIQEALRLCPPIHQFVMREAKDDIELDGWRIPKDMTIVIPIYHLQHDPDYWEEPEKFDPTRFSPENKSSRNPMVWQPFGAGPRNCIGVRFAMMQAKLVLAKILRKYNLQTGQKTDKGSPVLDESFANIKPKNDVYLTVVLRST